MRLKGDECLTNEGMILTLTFSRHVFCCSSKKKIRVVMVGWKEKKKEKNKRDACGNNKTKKPCRRERFNNTEHVPHGSWLAIT